jgi:hypothetical protein
MFIYEHKTQNKFLFLNPLMLEKNTTNLMYLMSHRHYRHTKCAATEKSRSRLMQFLEATKSFWKFIAYKTIGKRLKTQLQLSFAYICGLWFIAGKY